MVTWDLQTIKDRFFSGAYALPMLSPHIPIFPKPASQSNQCKRLWASSMVARPNSRRSLTHNSFDPRCSNGRLFP